MPHGPDIRPTTDLEKSLAAVVRLASEELDDATLVGACVAFGMGCAGVLVYLCVAEARHRRYRREYRRIRLDLVERQRAAPKDGSLVST